VESRCSKTIIGLIQNMSYLEISGEKHFLFGRYGAKKNYLKK